MYDKAVAAIRLARGKGFRVTINCTLFSGENPDEVAEFFDDAMRLGIEGITVSPGYSYQHAPRQDVFLGRNASKRLFRGDLQARPQSQGTSGRSRAAGPSITPRCSWISWPATSPINARPGATRPTTSSAGSGRAICSPMRATRRVSAR